MLDSILTEEEILPFMHKPHDHCESGAVSNLFNFYGLKLSEPMVFGLGAGLYFAHISYIKVMNAPIISYRYLPGSVFKHAAKILGIEVEMKSFQSKNKAEEYLDQKVQEDIPVGLISDMFYLTYMPEMFRFHFNAHNLVVYGKKEDKYCISDSILEMPVMLDKKQLTEARFGKGLSSPRGKMYWITKIPEQIDIKGAIKSSIKTVCNRMALQKMPWSGYRGIKNLAKNIANYPNKFKEEKANAYLLNIVRMQEIVGTGGSGFRKIYAQFLKEAAEVMQSKELAIFADRMLGIADEWRNFALLAAKTAKMKTGSRIDNFKKVSDYLYNIAELERQFFVDLNSLEFN